MREPHATEPTADFVMEEPQAVLEGIYIEAYLSSKGYTLQSVQELPEAETKQLMAEASAYASTRLAEVEMRAHLVKDIHGSAPPL